MSSNLTGKFIANTYQKLLQVDNVNGSNGAANFDVTDVKDGTYDLLNGIGQELPYMVVNQLSSGNGGYFIRKGDTDDDVVGLQIENYNGNGIQFWNGTYGSNGNLFLKNTGSLWVGYRGSSNDITTDVVDSLLNKYQGLYNLYVADGIQINPITDPSTLVPSLSGDKTAKLQIGTNSSNHTSRINMNADIILFDNYYDTQFNFYMNGEHPFTYIQYEFEFRTDDDNTTRDLIWPAGHPNSGNTIDSSEYIATVVGFKFDQDRNNPWPDTPVGLANDVYISGIAAWLVKNSGIWKINATWRKRVQGTVGHKDVRFNVWVMVIKKGFYLDASSSAISI